MPRARGPRARGKFVLAMGVVLFWSAISLAPDTVIVLSIKRQAHAAAAFAAVPGTVTSSSVKQGAGSHGGSVYQAELQYTYTVAGVVYTGDRYFYGYSATSDYADA